MGEEQTFKIGDDVKLCKSGERGDVIGKAEYASQPPQFYVRYVDGNGCQVKGWFDAADLTAG